jgi:hypothetical protein
VPACPGGEVGPVELELHRKLQGRIEGGRRWIFSYSSDMCAIGVIGMMRNMELYQTFLGGVAPRWSCSTVELRGSATPELFSQSWSSAKLTISDRYGHVFVMMVTFILFSYIIILIQQQKNNINLDRIV